MNHSMNKRKNTKRKIFPALTLPLILFTMFLLMTIGISIGDESGTEQMISDSISPMKLEFDFSKNDGEAITKTVFLRNTGTEQINYRFYVENKNSGNQNIETALKLSEKTVTILPNENFELEISLSADDIKNINNLNETKLKMIRNPETQTPVGYIIPISFEVPENTGNEENKKQDSGKTGNSANLSNSTGNLTAASNSTNKNENSIENDKSENESGGNNEFENGARSAKTGLGNENIVKVIIAIICLLSAASLLFLMIVKKKKFENE
jgi:hypothetical protein